MNADSNRIEHEGLRTKITFQRLDSLWHKNTLRDSSHTLLPQDSLSLIEDAQDSEAESSPEDPGPAPFFMFLP